MKQRFVALLATIVAAAPTPAAATPAGPVPMHTYYGPIRACTPLFAFDVRSGEGYIDATREHLVRIGHHIFAFGARWYLDGPQHRDFAVPMGTVDVPGLGRLERVQLTARNAGGPHVIYLYDTGYQGPGGKAEIRSDQFDGSNRDIAKLGRLVSGERRTTMCADVPTHLRPRPEREDSDAFWISQERLPGPLTLCWSKLALVVRRGEAVIPFWESLGSVGVAIGDTRVTIGGNFQAPFEQGWRRVRGSLAAHSEFQVREDLSLPAFYPPALRALDGSEPRRLRLVRLAEDPETHPSGGVGFAFSGPITDTGIAAFVRRLRLQTPRDTCLTMAS